MDFRMPKSVYAACICNVITAAVSALATAAQVDTNAPSIVSRDILISAISEYWGNANGPQEIVEPNVKVIDESDCGDYIKKHLSYFVEAGERSYAYLLIPKALKKNQRLPLMLCPHPTGREGKDRTVGSSYFSLPKDAHDQQLRTNRQYALELVRRGYICFAPDRAGFGERAPCPNDLSWDVNLKQARRNLQKKWPGWSMNAKAVWDLQRALDFLVKYDVVDSNRIGIIGHSLGGWDSQFLSAVDTRIKAAVVNGAGNIKFREELWESSQELRKFLSESAKFDLYTSTNILMMATAPRPLLYIKALNDPGEKGQPSFLEGYRAITRYYKIASKSQNNVNFKAPFAIYFHNNQHSFELDSRMLAYTWLDIYLKDSSTEKQ